MNAPARKEVTTVEAKTVPVVPGDPILDLIERAARDPAVDVEKMRQLLDMRAQAEARASERAFDAAMTAAQEEMRPVRADAHNPQTRSRYASYAALDRALRPIYTKYKFSLSFNTEPPPAPEFVRVSCMVSCAGHSRKYQIDMPADGKGAKGGDVMTKTHATGSAVSYGMRYLLKMIFNISVGDDDGNTASAAGDTGEVISRKQADDLIDLLESRNAPRAKFLSWAKVDRIEDIRAVYYDSCVAAIKNFGK